MNLMEMKDLISSLAVLTTILQFLSGTLVCKQYFVNRTTAESSSLPFICGVLSAGLWLLYGLTKRDDKIVLVNIVGVTLMIAYTIIFYIFTYKKSAVLKQVVTVASSLFFILWYAIVEENRSLLLERLGLMACCLTIITIAAPMSKLFYVMKVKNTECLPFPLIFMSFLVSSLWFLYGAIVEDNYIIVPNFLGAVLAFAQLTLFVIYPSQPSQFSTKPILA